MRYFTIFVIFLLLSLSGRAQHLESFKNVVPDAYNFWVYTPPLSSQNDSIDSPTEVTDTAKTKPLVVFIHGASLCGRDLSRVRRYGVLHAIQMGLNLDAYVLAPQNPGGAWRPACINRCLDYVVANYPIDTTRIYVIGMSLGGFGTIDYLSVYHDRIAAAMAICGGGNASSYCGLNDVPLWIVHGNADRQVSIASSRKVVNAMRQCNDSVPLLIFTELNGVNHTFPARLFYLESTYNWLMSHRRDSGDMTVNRDYSISTTDMTNAYHKLRRGHTPIKVVTDAHTGDAAGVQASAPAKKKDKEKKETQQHYVVKKGDTLSKIAKQHGTTVAKLCQINGIKQNANLRIGQKIKVR